MGLTRQLRTTAADHLIQHFAAPEIENLLILDRGDGPYVFDTDGNRYIDALSSLFCSQIGYSYGEEMAAASSHQLTTLAFNTNWATAHPAAIELAERLADLAPEGMSRVFFTNGGSEAVEAAWKLVCEYFHATGEPQRTKAIARQNAYHGVTLGALSFTGVEPFKAPFGRPPIDVAHVANTNSFRAPDRDDPDGFGRRLLKELEETIVALGADEVALIIAEPVQNAGGCLTPPPAYWKGLRALADKYGALLMADEVITGCGRLGEWFGVSLEGVAPDLVSLAKGLTSAYAPMGAVVANERVVAPLTEQGRPFRHGITFGGHPASAAIALKNIEIFERDQILENVRALEGYLETRMREQLQDISIVGDIRGRGFFWAVELVRDEEDNRFDASERDRLLRGFLPRRLREAGIIARCDDRGDSVLQIAPPLISTESLLDDIVDALETVLIDTGAHMQTRARSKVP